MLKIDKTDADLERFVYLAHRFVVEVRNFVGKSLFIDRTNLLKQKHGIPVESMGGRVDLDMRRQLRFLNLRRDGRYDDSRAEAIADIILNNEHGTYTALLRTYDR